MYNNVMNKKVNNTKENNNNQQSFFAKGSTVIILTYLPQYLVGSVGSGGWVYVIYIGITIAIDRVNTN